MGVFSKSVRLKNLYKKQFDAPPAAELRAGQSWFGEIVGEEHQRLAGLWLAKTDAAQRRGMIAPGLEATQDDGLVEAQVRGLVHGARVVTLESKVVFGPGDEEGRSGVQPVQVRKI